MAEWFQARILSERYIGEELAKGNFDVVLALGAALNPTMFSGKVDFLKPASEGDQKDYAVIRIRGTEKAYAIHYETVAKMAILLKAKNGKTSEVMQSIEQVTENKTRYIG